MDKRQREKELKERIDQLVEKVPNHHEVVRILEGEKGCLVTTAEYGWSTVSQGWVRVAYPFVL